PKWNRIDAAFKAADGLTYFFNNDEKAFVTSDNLGELVPYNDFWDMANAFAADGASVSVNAAFVRGDYTYLIGAGKILKYSGNAYDWVQPGYPKDNSLFNLLADLGCDNNEDAYKEKPVLNANFDGTNALISVKGASYILRGTVVEKITPNPTYTGFVLNGQVFEFKTNSLIVDGDTTNKINVGRKIDAAFAGKDGAVYVFSSVSTGEFLVVPQLNLTGAILADAIKAGTNFNDIG